MSQQAKRYNIYPSRIDHYHPHLTKQELSTAREVEKTPAIRVCYQTTSSYLHLGGTTRSRTKL